jgi:hypothetical protein
VLALWPEAGGVSAKQRIPPPRLALSVMEAAASVDMSHDAFKQHVAPQLKWVRCGRMKRVPVRVLEDWLLENAEKLPAELLDDNHNGRRGR